MTKQILWHTVLEDLLIRGYKIEALGEYVYQNMGLLDKETLEFEEYSDEFLTLIEDSKWHKQRLEDLFEKTNLPILQHLFKTKENLYENYSLNTEAETNLILKNLVRNENAMNDLYKDIKTKTSNKLVNKIWTKDNPKTFLSTMDTLIDSEEKHQDIIQELLGNKEFISDIQPQEIKNPKQALKKIEKTKNQLNQDLSNGIRDALFFKSNQELYEEITKKIENKPNVSLRSENQINNKKIFEIEIKSQIC